jgi:hypothetical protein
MSKSKKQKTTNAPWMARQGDVLIVAIPESALPAKLVEVPKDAGRVVLAYGEVTGHSHAIARSASLYRDENDARFLRVSGGGAKLKHEEHAAIAIPPGAYRVVIQNEYSPEEIRQVAD